MPRFPIPRFLSLGGKERVIPVGESRPQLNARNIEQDPKDAVIGLYSMGRDYDRVKVARQITEQFPDLDPVEVSSVLSQIEANRIEKGRSIG